MLALSNSGTDAMAFFRASAKWGFGLIAIRATACAKVAAFRIFTAFSEMAATLNAGKIPNDGQLFLITESK